MKIVVTIKQILDPSGFTVNRKSEKVFVNREEYIVNPADLNALEMALRVKTYHDDVEVIALGLGPARIDDALREVIARGADRAILITDFKTDAAGAARLMAAAIEKIGDVSMVICGAAAMDSGAGQLPGWLAETLGWPMLSEIYAIEKITNNVVQGSQRTARLETNLPALLTVPRHANDPRHIYGARAINSYREGLVVTWGLDDLGLTPDDLAPLTTVGGRRFPPERTLGSRLDGSIEEAVESLLARLQTNELI